ncbi:MAG: amidohydrolase family protein [Candidatus Binatia bacterium]
MSLVVDADGHVLEPRQMWRDYVEPRLRDRPPTIERRRDGREDLVIDGKVISRFGINRIGALGAGAVNSYEANCPGGFDPHARLRDLDQEGIDAVVLYPTLGLLLGGVEGPELYNGLCRAYNRWLADYCSTAPRRLFGAAMIPVSGVESAVAELRFSAEKLGHRAVFLRPNPWQGRRIYDREWDLFWAVVEEMNVGVGIHEGLALNLPTVGVERFDDLASQHIVAHTLEMQCASLGLITQGVLERFRGVRVAFLESGGGWMLPWLERIEEHWESPSYRRVLGAMKRAPFETFRSQCFIAFELEERTLAVHAEHCGAETILWATDYPHPDGTFPGAVEKIRKTLVPLSEDARRLVLGENARRLYALPI